MDGITHPPKRSHYPAVIEGYLKWWGRKRVEWFDPPRGEWRKGDIRITVRPELGLSINDIPHVIKLHFSGDSLSKRRVDIIHRLMETRLSYSDEMVVGVLDIRKSRLLIPTVQKANLDAVLEGEMAYIRAMWEAI